MSNVPFFSVILNTHNSQKTIEKTLKSILNQTFLNFELIAIDDDSLDDTVGVIKRIIGKSHTKIKYQIVTLNENKGISFSRNLGIDKAVGRYTCFIDGDDMWQKEKLEIQYDFLASSNFLVDWVFSNYYVINDQYEVVSVRERKSGVYYYKNVIHDGNPVGMLTVAVKTSVLKREKFRKIKHEDYDLWIRLSKKGLVGFLINKNLAMYMKHSKSLSSNKCRSLIWTYKVFRKNNISVLHSSYLLIRYILNYFSRESLMRNNTN